MPWRIVPLAAAVALLFCLDVQAQVRPTPLQKAQGFYLAAQKAEKDKQYAQAADAMAEAISRAEERCLPGIRGQGRSAGGRPPTA